MKIVIFGLSLSSSWGNGHATTYRALIKALHKRGHDVIFYERDVPWYANHRDMPASEYCNLQYYQETDDISANMAGLADADAIILGSYVPEGVRVAQILLDAKSAATPLAFYDIDTPVTLGKLERGDYEYLTPELIPRFDLYLSFSGGRALDILRDQYGARQVHPLYCGVDTGLYRPEPVEKRWELGYLGTYSPDRQPVLETLLIEPARRLPDKRFIVAGPQYPEHTDWPDNVAHIEHIAPSDHALFYSQLRFALNITRAEMIKLGHSPSVRLFEAAACGASIISDCWEGMEDFFEPGRELFQAAGTEDVIAILNGTDASHAAAIGAAGRARVERQHTAAHRAEQLETWLKLARAAKPQGQSPGTASTPRLPAEEIQAEIAGLGPWFHNLHLPGDVETAPGHFLGDFPRFKWEQIKDHLPTDLSGARVLDIGCNAGFYSFALAARGATVLGIDTDTHYLRQAEWARTHFNAENVEFKCGSVYDIDRLGHFDLILFMGVFYHLRYPLLALDLLAAAAPEMMVFQTLTFGDETISPQAHLETDFETRHRLAEKGWPHMAFIETTFCNDPTNWWVPNHAAVEAMLRSSGFTVTARPAHEIYLCSLLQKDAASKALKDHANQAKSALYRAGE